MSKLDLLSENNNSKLSLFILFFLVLNFIISIFLFSKRETYILANGAESQTPSKSDFCSVVGKQLINKKISDKVVAPDIYSAITEKNYSAMEFDGTERLFGISEKDDQCEISIKDSLGVRVFKLTLIQNKEWPSLGYLLSGIYETVKGE